LCRCLSIGGERASYQRNAFRFFFFDILQGYKCSSAPAPKYTLCVVFFSRAAGIRSLPDTARLRSINTWLLSF
jgi:hypothetical protein